MDKDSVHYSSVKHDWETPRDLFDALDAEFHFTLDAAASPENAKCEKFYTYKENGLSQSFAGERVWINPPYGSDLARWVHKGVTEPSDVTVMLVPARTDTRWWGLFWNYDKHCPIAGCEVRFIKGRVKFTGGARIPTIGTHRSLVPSLFAAPFPSAVIVINK